MAQIIAVKEAANISEQLKKQGKKSVLVGGCFDILHAGHIQFLTEAKKNGDILFVLLESDKNIMRYKGPNRPINNQQDRALLLSVITGIDYVILLPTLTSDQAYDEMILALQPDIIATTIGDPYRSHKERQAKKIQAQVVDVIQRITNTSTSRLAELLTKEL